MAAAAPGDAAIDPAAEGGLYCSTAGEYFESKDDLTEHYRSDFHRCVASVFVLSGAGLCGCVSTERGAWRIDPIGALGCMMFAVLSCRRGVHAVGCLRLLILESLSLV